MPTAGSTPVLFDGCILPPPHYVRALSGVVGLLVPNSAGFFDGLLEDARKQSSSREILLWMTPSEALEALQDSREILLWMIPSEPPKALQASECSELLDPMRASCQIPAQH